MIGMAIMLNDPMVRDQMRLSTLPISIQYTMSYLGFVIKILSGIVILNGRNWGRLLYVAWHIISITVAVTSSPTKAAVIPGLMFFLVVTFFLFRREAEVYFSPAGEPDNA